MSVNIKRFNEKREYWKSLLDKYKTVVRIARHLKKTRQAVSFSLKYYGIKYERKKQNLRINKKKRKIEADKLYNLLFYGCYNLTEASRLMGYTSTGPCSNLARSFGFYDRYYNMLKSPVIGKNIKKLRERFFMSQKELAEKIGKFQAHISYIETGKSSVTMKTIRKIAKILDVTPQELLKGVYVE